MSPENPRRSFMTLVLAHTPHRAAWARSRDACPFRCQVASTPDALRGDPSRTESDGGIQGLILSAKPTCAYTIFPMQNSAALRSLIAEAVEKFDRPVCIGRGRGTVTLQRYLSPSNNGCTVPLSDALFSFKELCVYLHFNTVNYLNIIKILFHFILYKLDLFYYKQKLL